MEKITFKGAHGEPLDARLDEPEGERKTTALFAHCFTCGKDIFAASAISKSLSKRGIAVLRFDFTGLGSSGGEFSNTSFSSNVQDLVKAADYLRDQYDSPALLIGHSLGGAAVLAAAEHIPESRAVITIGAPSDVSHVLHHFSEHEEEIREKGEAEVKLAGRPFTITQQFIDDARQQTLQDKIKTLDRALLVMHAPLDNIVGIENAGSIFGSARHPKSFISLDDADHLLTRRKDIDYAASVIAAWAERYIGEN